MAFFKRGVRVKHDLKQPNPFRKDLIYCSDKNRARLRLKTPIRVTIFYWNFARFKHKYLLTKQFRAKNTINELEQCCSFFGFLSSGLQTLLTLAKNHTNFGVDGSQSFRFYGIKYKNALISV